MVEDEGEVARWFLLVLSGIDESLWSMVSWKVMLRSRLSWFWVLIVLSRNAGWFRVADVV